MIETKDCQGIKSFYTKFEGLREQRKGGMNENLT